MATHAHITRALLRPEVAEPIGLLGRGQRQPGPVTMAIRAVRSDGLAPFTERDRLLLREVRTALCQRIERDLAILDALDGDSCLEDDEREPDDSGIGDFDGLGEQIAMLGGTFA